MNKELFFLARAVKYIFNPLLIVVYSIGILLLASPSLAQNSFEVKIAAFKMVLLTILVTPLAAIGLSRLTTKLIGGEKSPQFERIVICVVVVLSYISAIYILRPFFTNFILFRLFFPPILLISLWLFVKCKLYKFSISTAAAVAATTLLYMFAYIGVNNLCWYILGAIIITGIISTANMIIGEDCEEIIFGAIWGFVSVFFTFMILGILRLL